MRREQHDHQAVPSNNPEKDPITIFYLDLSSKSWSTATLEKSQQKHLIIQVPFKILTTSLIVEKCPGHMLFSNSILVTLNI